MRMNITRSNGEKSKVNREKVSNKLKQSVKGKCNYRTTETGRHVEKRGKSMPSCQATKKKKNYHRGVMLNTLL